MLSTEVLELSQMRPVMMTPDSTKMSVLAMYSNSSLQTVDGEHVATGAPAERPIKSLGRRAIDRS
jgi:hypothetical protein